MLIVVMLAPWVLALVAFALLAAIALQIANDRPDVFLPDIPTADPASLVWAPGQREGGDDLAEARTPIVTRHLVFTGTIGDRMRARTTVRRWA